MTTQPFVTVMEEVFVDCSFEALGAGRNVPILKRNVANQMPKIRIPNTNVL